MNGVSHVVSGENLFKYLKTFANFCIKYIIFSEKKNYIEDTRKMSAMTDIIAVIPQHFFYILLFFGTSLWLLCRWQKNSRLYRLGNQLPGPHAYPIFGNALEAIGKQTDSM